MNPPLWRLADQSPAAQIERIHARIAAAAARAVEEARRPHNPALRAFNEAREAERRAEYDALANATDGMSEAKEAARIHWRNRRNAA